MATRVLIVGGGSGATILANTLDRRRFEVTMVTSSLEHLFQPALLYIAFTGAQARPVRDERGLLARHVRLVHDTVTAVDLEARWVSTSGGDRLGYDRVVLATGISTDPSQIPGLADVTAQVGDYHSTVANARRLWQSLEGFPGGTIALGQGSPICKCPPSPLEGILLTDRLLRRRGLREATRLVFFTPYPRAYPALGIDEIVAPILAARGIEVMTFFDVDRVDPTTRTITSIEGDVIRTDLPIVIPPFTGAPISYTPPGILDESRFVVTHPRTLQVRGFDDAFAIGDAANLPTSKSGVGAHLQAKVVAAALEGRAATFDGRTHCPFDLGDGRGTFVTSSYDAPTQKARPTRLKHAMKMGFALLYWASLRGWLDPVFDAYFRLTTPRPPSPPAGGVAGDSSIPQIPDPGPG